MEYLLILAAVILIIIAGLWIFIARQGDAEIEFLVEQRTDFILEEISIDTAVFSAQIPFVNKGTQDGTIMDCYPRHLLPSEQYDAATLFSRIELDSRRRADGYYESAIIPKTTGSSIILTLVFKAKTGGIKEAIKEMPDMAVDIVYQIVARSDWYITKQRLDIESDEFKKLLEGVSWEESNG